MNLYEERRVTEPTEITVEKAGLYSHDGKVVHLRSNQRVVVTKWLQFLSDDAMNPDDPLPFEDER